MATNAPSNNNQSDYDKFVEQLYEATKTYLAADGDPKTLALATADFLVESILAMTQGCDYAAQEIALNANLKRQLWLINEWSNGNTDFGDPLCPPTSDRFH